jgi:hypothetical protein
MPNRSHDDAGAFDRVDGPVAAGAGSPEAFHAPDELLSHLLGLELDQDERLEDGLTYCMR